MNSWYRVHKRKHKFVPVLKHLKKKDIDKMDMSTIAQEHRYAHIFWNRKKENPKWGKEWTLKEIKRIHDWLADKLPKHKTPLK